MSGYGAPAVHAISYRSVASAPNLIYLDSTMGMNLNHYRLEAGRLKSRLEAA